MIWRDQANGAAEDLTTWQSDVIFIGRLIEGKGVETIIEAIALLAKNSRKIRLAVVGQGPLRPVLEEQARRLAVDAQVRFHGLLSSPDLVKCLKASKALALCSNSYPEGFGIVVAEAMACGKPVIVSDQPPLVETAGAGGIVVPQGDSVALARRVETVLEDRQLYDRLSQGAQTRVRDFALERVGEQYVRYLQTVLSNGG